MPTGHRVNCIKSESVNRNNTYKPKFTVHPQLTKWQQNNLVGSFWFPIADKDSDTKELMREFMLMRWELLCLSGLGWLRGYMGNRY